MIDKVISNIIEIEGIGFVLFKSSRKYKRITIKLKPFAGVEVMYPKSSSLKKAKEFVNSKKSWIINSKEKIKQQENKHTIFDENSVFKTANFTLKIQKYRGENVSIQLKNGILNVYYPEKVSISNNLVQEAIRFGIEKAMRLEAKKTFPERVSQLSLKYGFKYNKLFIKNLKSRWGSCSAVNNINLNLQLVRLPDYLCDYVILHELCHTKEKNHGQNFWNLLNNCTNNKAKILAKEIRGYRTYIY